MRCQAVISGLMAISVFGCADNVEIQEAANPAPAETTSDHAAPAVASQETSLPYQLIETKTDGSRVVEYQVTVKVSETRVRTQTTDGVQVEEQYSVEVPVVETRQALVPPSEDIDNFLKNKNGGNESPVELDVPEALPAPAPPA